MSTPLDTCLHPFVKATLGSHAATAAKLTLQILTRYSSLEAD